MGKIKEHVLNGSAIGLAGTLLTLSYQHPEMIKDFAMFLLAWILLKKEIPKKIQDAVTVSVQAAVIPIVEAIKGLTETMGSVERNHSDRLTKLETVVYSNKTKENEHGTI